MFFFIFKNYEITFSCRGKTWTWTM